MEKFEYKVTDPSGIHARPAGLLVKEASKYASAIKLSVNDKSADAKRLFSVMGLNVKCGDNIVISANGEDEKVAAENLEKFFKDNL